MRGNALRMEELGADVEKLDRAADRKAEEALAARKRQAELLAELATVQEREKGEAAALAALRAERAVLMEQEAAAGEEIADWAREECDYEVEVTRTKHFWDSGCVAQMIIGTSRADRPGTQWRRRRSASRRRSARAATPARRCAKPG